MFNIDFVYPNSGIRYVLDYNNIEYYEVQDDIIYIGSNHKRDCITFANDKFLTKLIRSFK